MAKSLLSLKISDNRWHSTCVVGQCDVQRECHLFHFDAPGVFRFASNSAGRSHLPFEGLGSAACGRGVAAGAQFF